MPVRTLVLANEDFRSRDAGSRIRDWYLTRALSRLGDTTVLAFAAEAAPGGVHPIPAVEFFLDGAIPESRSLALSAVRGSMYHVERYAFARHRSWSVIASREYDIIYASMLYATRAADVLASSATVRPKVIWDTHNFDADVWIARSLSGTWLQRSFARAMGRRSEPLVGDAVRTADLILACTESDKAALEGLGPSVEVALVPNAADVEAWSEVRSVPAEPNTFVLFGSLKQDSTSRGAIWFLENVWPPYRAEQGDATLAVTGRAPSAALSDLASSEEGVTLIANPADIREPVAAGGVVVVPQIWGTGSKLKMHEALASGRRVVASPAAVVGLAEELLEHVLIASSPEEWRVAMRKASKSPIDDQEWHVLQSAINRHGSWSASERCLRDAIAGLDSP